VRSSVAVSKRSLARTYFASRVSAFNHQEPNYQLEKAHHQAAPLTDSTLYAPQGHTSTPVPNASASSPTTTQTANESTSATVFTPSVNAVFDD
ncbi:hypothetical protein BD560DRAFT_384533, partial [Blakeslea trispora]